MCPGAKNGRREVTRRFVRLAQRGGLGGLVLAAMSLGVVLVAPGEGGQRQNRLARAAGLKAFSVAPASGNAADRRVQLGRMVTAQSGCLACHRIGNVGHDGPGPDLTTVALRLPRRAIARALTNPTAPMPSFRNLPHGKFRALVAYLSHLRSRRRVLKPCGDHGLPLCRPTPRRRPVVVGHLDASRFPG